VSTLSAVTSGNPIILGPGTYWLDWDSSDTANAAHFDPPLTPLGTRALAGWNGRQFAAGAWGDTIDGGNPTTAPDVIMDLTFQVNGSTIANNCLLALPPCAGDVWPAPNGNGIVD